MKVYQLRAMILGAQGGVMPTVVGTYEDPKQVQEAASQLQGVLGKAKVVMPDGSTHELKELLRILGLSGIGLDGINYGVASPIVAAAPNIIMPAGSTKQ